MNVMKIYYMPATVRIMFIALMVSSGLSVGGQVPEAPRIESVIPLKIQPHASDPNTIWYDDFDGDPKPYPEARGSLDRNESLGEGGRSMLCHFRKGQVSGAGRKVFFGDSPVYPNKVVRKGESFDEIYWRIYVKHQAGWIGSPAKMSRATSMASAGWSQAMIMHVWSGNQPGTLTLDPVRGVQGNKVVTRKYNDFPRMKWLGNRPESMFPVHATEESGYWVLIECRTRLNTPGKNDGLAQLWIDGRLECERTNLNLRGTYTEHGINAVFLEAYWNAGSPVSQSRWYDNFVISTRRIGPVVCPVNPTIIRTPYRGQGTVNGEKGRWEVEAASDYHGMDVVFRSNLLSNANRFVMNARHGTFTGSLQGKSALDQNQNYFLRIRHMNAAGTYSPWSRWHQEFKTTSNKL